MIPKQLLDLDTLSKTMLSLLPEDGTPVLNRIMRVMLARKLEQRIDDGSFFGARDILLSRGLIGRLRGQGGQMFLAEPLPDEQVNPKLQKPIEGWSEQKLMAPLKTYLEGPFRRALELPASGACIVQDTSVMGPHKGKWARPDFILVSAMRFRLMPGAQIDLHSFELKTEAGGSVLAIHEALAQTRFTHFGHFVWHLPEGSKAEAMLDDIVTHCEEHGIGLIRMKDPKRPTDEESWDVLVDPRRKPTLGSVVDGFLEARLSAAQKDVFAPSDRSCSVKNGEDRTGKFIAVANMKGGVGKTTTVVSLAEALSADDESVKVLVIDLDPQASASVAIAGDTILAEMIRQRRTLEYLIEEKLINRNKIDAYELLHKQVSGTWYSGRQLDVALLPCGPHLRVVEKELLYELAKTDHSFGSIDGQINKFFQSSITPLCKNFDYILFDCAPGISPVTEMAIRLSDLVVVPTIPDYLSVYGLNAFYESIWKWKPQSLPQPKSLPCILVTRMQRNIRQHVEVIDNLREQTAQPKCGYRLFDHQIPTSAALVEALMKEEGLTLVQKYTQPVVTNVLVPLVKEVKEMLR